MTPYLPTAVRLPLALVAALALLPAALVIEALQEMRRPRPEPMPCPWLDSYDATHTRV